MSQIIQRIRYGGQERTANVCLHKDHLDQTLHGKTPNLGQGLADMGDQTGRMACIEWKEGFSIVDCRLMPIDGIQQHPLPGMKKFIFVPDFYSDSIISRAIANHFGLIDDGNPVYFANPLEYYAHGNAIPIETTGMTQAIIQFDWTASMNPSPNDTESYDFRISDTVDANFAILGRNIIDRLLLLYQGYSYDGLQSYRPSPSGHVYFGSDSRLR